MSERDEKEDPFWRMSFRKSLFLLQATFSCRRITKHERGVYQEDDGSVLDFARPRMPRLPVCYGHFGPNG